MPHVSLVAVLNATPNSIDREGELPTTNELLDRARQLVADGADFIDVGAQATNPWAEEITAEEEWQRLEPLLSTLLELLPGRISLDTFQPEVAEKALNFGKVILNDVTMFHNPQMVQLAAENRARCIVSHLPLAAHGSVSWAHEHATMDQPVDVLRELLQRRREMIEAGVRPQDIIIDPGIGFGKTSRLNRQLLEFGDYTTDRLLLHSIDPECVSEPVMKVMIGASYKRVIADHFGGDKKDPSANLRAATIAANHHTSYLRVHEPTIYKELKNASQK